MQSLVSASFKLYLGQRESTWAKRMAASSLTTPTAAQKCVAKLLGFIGQPWEQAAGKCKTPESLVVADILKLLPCLCPSVCLHRYVQEPSPLQFSLPGGSTASLCLHKSLLLTTMHCLCFCALQSPRDAAWKIPSQQVIHHFHHFGFQIYSFVNF